jgi:hypothetical protein
VARLHAAAQPLTTCTTLGAVRFDTKEAIVGFLDKLKGTAKQAVSPGSQMNERDKIMKINESGVDGRATVNAMNELGSQFGGGKEIEFDLTVHGAGGDYPLTMKQSIHEQALAGIAVGGEVVVKIDPDDPQSLLVWGAAS